MAENSEEPTKPSNKKTEKKPAAKRAKKPASQKTPKKEETDQVSGETPKDKTPQHDHKKPDDSKIESVKETLNDGFSKLKDKLEDLSSSDKISDEFEKAKSEAQKTNWLSDIITAFRFFTRLPLPASDREKPMNGKALWAAPIVGVVVGLIGGLVFIFAAFLGLPDMLCATLALSAMIVSTGCFHEDAIADVADGFGGGWTKEQKLEIMKDSRIGTYGATTLFLALIIKIGAITSLSAFADTPVAMVMLLIASSVASRAAGVALLALLPPLRDMSSGREPGNPNSFTLILALLIGTSVSSVCLMTGFGFGAMLAGLAGAVIGGGFVGWLTNRQIGGQTGDVAGTCQQAAETGMLLAALISLSV